LIQSEVSVPIAKLNGNKLYFEVTGAGPDTIVFSHGAFLDHTLWDDVVAQLSEQFRCVTWDARGHGMSECNGPFDYWDAAHDALGLLELAGADTGVFVGMSQGGWLSQRAALIAPDKVRGLVLQGTSVAPFSPEEQAGYRQLAEAWVAMGPVGDLGGAVLDIHFGGADYDGSRFLQRWQAKPPAAWAQVWDSILGRDDIRHRMKEISCPVAVVHGSADAALTMDTARELASMLRTCIGTTTIVGAPHAAALSHPRELAAAIWTLWQGLNS
jgi:pimeloyl-ACP methyl ester carboxylesterase